MRIAFTSCMSAGIFPDQPVWDWIAAQQPDHLVLLGDSVYLDVPVLNMQHPSEMSDNDFAQHLFALYSAQLAQPSFRALVQGLPKGRVWSIWDDHDFLWNDACGAEVRKDAQQRDKLRTTTAFQEAFRAALSAGLAPGSFPAAYNAAVFWQSNQPPLSTPSVALAPDVWLHLSDGRSYRTRTWLLAESKRTILGADQRQRLSQAVLAAPGALHLLASGSTLGAYKRGYAQDWRWLSALAAQERILVLSGDIHRNDCDAFHTGGWPLHEATASGAAVRDAVVVGARRRNYGLLDISADRVSFRLFADNKEETRLARTLARSTWLPV